MGRKILFITTDQQRYDSLGCNGGTIARTPVVDGSPRAASTTSARTTRTPCACRRARRCSPASTCARTASSPTACRCRADAPSVAAYLHDKAGYRTALLGKAHFEPGFDLRAAAGSRTAWRARARPVRTAASSTSSSRCTCRVGSAAAALRPLAASRRTASRRSRASRRCSRREPRRRHRRARDATYNPIPREWYHTDWVADRTIAYLDSLPDDADWFVWMSFPDPHHPWDPPASRAAPRATGATSTCRPAIPARTRRSSAVLAQKPAHWLASGTRARCVNAEGGPGTYRPQNVTARQHPRDQRDDAHHERADRRGVRPRARAASPRAAGTPTPTCSSRPITASCRATTA